ncbi:hypothetical protein SBOR_0021 [Sclerotinia borealis F-4128]|uniref:Pyridine nucleotide-disulfide oxidoreductase family protein n=1 Tax=Sclerotinia borealis (strain F-4128) TaxID=1432307 RepID=W9CY89_SCLBF|nr:hypothetical protein SBOR_0021 [Sclerotinia borealis F-4128]
MVNYSDRTEPVLPIDVTNYAIQTPKQRFSADHVLDHVNDLQHSIHELPRNAKTASLTGAPRPAFWRMNLVALSQKYNMYFAAYMDTIHVTKPRTIKQILPGVPDLILRLPVSKNAGPGYLDRNRPHCVNNMIIGNLGDKEILLFCTDDGDVTAYYTYLIAGELQSTVMSTASSIPIGSTKPFFLENVGSSAWGLAIHQKSRLIAVSSNKREVTVFVHGIHSNETCDCAVMGTTFDQFVHGNAQRLFPVEECYSKGRVYKSGGPLASSSFPLRTYAQHITRDPPRREVPYPPITSPCNRDFRLILKPGKASHNIPAITFADDKHGLAESILATDILGDLWLLKIWQSHRELIGLQLRGSEGRAPNQMSVHPQIIKIVLSNKPRGWGVMTIPQRFFKPSPNFQDALGMDYLDSVWENSVHNREGICCMNITSSMMHAEHFPTILQDANDVEPASSLIPSNQVIGVGAPGIMDNGEVEDGQPIFHELHGVEDEGDGAFVSGNMATFVEPIRNPNWSIIEDDRNDEQDQDENYIRSSSPPNQLQGLYASTKRKHSRTNPRGRQFAIEPKDFLEKFKFLITFGRVFNKMPEVLSMPGMRDIMFRDQQRYQRFPAFVEEKMTFQPILSDEAVILRTWRDSIELVSPYRFIPPVVCSHAFGRQRAPRAFGENFQDISRINMMALIPELSLVVVASQGGQAALLSLTTVDVLFTKSPITTFRIEALLPPRKVGGNHLPGDEEPNPPLLGLAVSPLQKGEDIELDAGDDPKKWRLIMQSYDHTIWTYELSRDVNDVLCVF